MSKKKYNHKTFASQAFVVVFSLSLSLSLSLSFPNTTVGFGFWTLNGPWQVAVVHGCDQCWAGINF